MADLLPDAVLRYDDHPDGLIDLHLPAVGTRVLVLVHGGFWKTAYDRTHTRQMARALADEGFVVATPEYRRVGPGGSGGWPTTADDVQRSVEALPSMLAGLGIEAGPVTVTGHSAGGHLALWLATRGLPIEKTVALAPVGDLRAAMDLDLGAGAVEAFLGDAEPDDADPMSLLQQAASGEVRIVHGVDDPDVPISLSRGLVARHSWVRLEEVPGGHFEVITPGSPAWATVLSALTGRTA